MCSVPITVLVLLGPASFAEFPQSAGFYLMLAPSGKEVAQPPEHDFGHFSSSIKYCLIGLRTSQPRWQFQIITPFKEEEIAF